MWQRLAVFLCCSFINAPLCKLWLPTCNLQDFHPPPPGITTLWDLGKACSYRVYHTGCMLLCEGREEDDSPELSLLKGSLQCQLSYFTQRLLFKILWWSKAPLMEVAVPWFADYLLLDLASPPQKMHEVCESEDISFASFQNVLLLCCKAILKIQLQKSVLNSVFIDAIATSPCTRQ